MSLAQTRTWFMILVRQPTRARWELGYQNRVVGRQIWQTGPWLCPIDPMSSKDVLDELWWAVLEARGENYKR